MVSTPFTSVPNAQSIIQGQVFGVSDGDTITVLQDNKQYKIRLYGIDCPEKKQAFGQRAKQFTSDQVFSQFVRVVSYDIDRYGRIVGMVYKGPYCLNEGLLNNGFAWSIQGIAMKISAPNGKPWRRKPD